MRRSLSVGAVGVMISGAVFAAANAAEKEAPQTTVDNGALVSAPALKSFASEGKGQIALWGVPAYIVAPEKPVEATPAVEVVEEAAPAEEAPAPLVEEAVVEAPAEEAPALEEAAPAPVEETQVSVQASTVEVVEAAPAPAAPAVQEALAPAPQVQAAAPAPAAPAVQEAPAPAPQVQAAAPAPAAAEPALFSATNQTKRDAVVAAARAAAAVNAQTDCTMLATNSLRAAGINFHGWPMDYMRLGTVTSNPQPGDLVLYQSNGFGQQHIAVYIGNGQAVHGGWNGIGTTIFSVNLPTASAPIFVSPAGYNS